MTRNALPRLLVASATALSAAAYLPAVTRGETVRVNGVVVIPVEENNAPIDGDAEGDASVKGIGLMSSGGQMKQRFLPLCLGYLTVALVRNTRRLSA